MEAKATRRILVVDDNVDSANSTAMLLTLDGYEVRCAYDGISAIAEATEFKPHVAVVDIGMPGMSGYEVAANLHSVACSTSMLLIALSGWGADADKPRCPESCFDHYLTKPADPQELRGLIASHATATM